MDDCVEVLIGDGWQLDKPHAHVLRVGVLNVMGSAIDRDLVSSLHQPLPQLFDTGFKATVAGRYAAGAEKGDLHQKTLS